MKDIDTKKNRRIWKRIWHLLKILEMKDLYTYIHCHSTAQYSVSFAKEIKFSNDKVDDLYLAAWLHDIGKLFLPTDLLQKPTKLTISECKLVKQHVLYGLDIVKIYNFPTIITNCIKYHHERWDGSGYPFRTTGNDTPIEGRILQITDAFSAMTNKRIYRTPLSLSDSLYELEKNSGTQFDPELVDIFINMLKRRAGI